MAMIGLDSYTATKRSLIGVDWLNLASGALKTAGGSATALDAMGKPQASEQAAADKAKAQAAQKAAEQSASTWKKVGIGALVAAALGGGWWWMHR